MALFLFAEKFSIGDMRDYRDLCVDSTFYAWIPSFMRGCSCLCVFTAVYAREIAVMRVSRDLCVNEEPHVARNALDQSRFI